MERPKVIQENALKLLTEMGLPPNLPLVTEDGHLNSKTAEVLGYANAFGIYVIALKMFEGLKCPREREKLVQKIKGKIEVGEIKVDRLHGVIGDTMQPDPENVEHYRRRNKIAEGRIPDTQGYTSKPIELRRKEGIPFAGQGRYAGLNRETQPQKPLNSISAFQTKRLK